MEKIINALLESIRAMEIEAVLIPQKAVANRPRIDLCFAGLELTGIDKNNPQAGNKGWERIIFNAEFKSDGTHSRWLVDAIIASRKLLPLGEKNMPLTVMCDGNRTVNLTAHWRRLSPGKFEYPDNEESSMPVRYVESWQVTVAYPANIITN